MSDTRDIRAEQGQTLTLNNYKTKLFLMCISHTKKKKKTQNLKQITEKHLECEKPESLLYHS